VLLLFTTEDVEQDPEGTVQESLDYIKKNLSIEESKEALRLLREINIITETSMILGFPDEAPESVEETLRLCMGFNPDFGHFLAIAPWPYAEIYPELKEYTMVHDYRRYNLVEPVVQPKNMTLMEVHAWLGMASRDYYMYKMNTLDTMTERKREFMIKVIHIIATSSYLAETMKGTSMPEDVRKMLGKLHAQMKH